MIVRILGEGQFDIGDAATTELNRLDTELEAAVNRNDTAAFTASTSIAALPTKAILGLCSADLTAKSSFTSRAMTGFTGCTALPCPLP